MTPFEFHTGIEYTQHGEQWIGTCPFCEKAEKFYFNKDFLWDCKNGYCVDKVNRKPRSGNLITFFRQLHEEFDTQTKAAQVISDARGIPMPHVTYYKPRYNPLNDTMLLPTYRHGKINNMYKIDRVNGKLLVLATPSCEHTLLNYPDEASDIIWVCEGQWDTMAAHAICSQHPEITIVGVPGAGVWKKAWTDCLADRDVVFLYDNDNNGKVGYERVIIKHIAAHPQKPKSVSYINWPADYAEKYDLNDLYRQHKRSSFAEVEKLITPFKVPEGTVIIKTTIETVTADKSIDTFEKFLERFQEVYHTTSDMELALLLVFCSIYSINIEGEQLWLRIIGPPGCGKTTIAKAISASENVVLKSTFTGLFSGWADEHDEDASMVPLIAGKTLIVKDADALLQQPNVQQIFSELRDFYDKDSSTQYRNRKSNDYRNIRSTMILCGTNVLRRADQAFLGERFLDFELRISKKDEEAIEDKMMERSMAVASNPSNVPPETPVQAAAKGFIEHLMSRSATYALPQELQKTIRRRAKLAALMRTKVDRDMYGKGDITFAPVAELPTRLIGQLVKLAVCAPVVLNNDKWVSTTKRLINKVVKDIIDPTSSRYVICRDLIEGWYTREQLMVSTNLSKSIVTRELDNLRALNLLSLKKDLGSRPGFSILSFTLEDSIKQNLIDLET